MRKFDYYIILTIYKPIVVLLFAKKIPVNGLFSYHLFLIITPMKYKNGTYVVTQLWEGVIATRILLIYIIQ